MLIHRLLMIAFLLSFSVANYWANAQNLSLGETSKPSAVPLEVNRDLAKLTERDQQVLQPIVMSMWSPSAEVKPTTVQYFVSPQGKPENEGTLESPWDITSTLAGQRKIAPGSIIWLMGGRYVYPVRSTKAGNGYPVKLSGAPGKVIHLRAMRNQRAIIDGGFQVEASHLWIWDLEFHLQEDWRPREPSPQGQNTQFKVPTGVINIAGGENIKLINCISHHNTMGVGFWKTVRDSEIHGCIIYDNGFLGTDRPHGPALYTQNQTKTIRLVADNIMAGNFSLPMQCYGSKIDLLVNDFLIEGNVCYAPRAEAKGRTYLLLGGSNSQNMVARNNLVYGYNVQMGKAANQVAQDNLVIRGPWSGPMPEKNNVLSEPKSDNAPIRILRTNKYDPRRAMLVVSNWSREKVVRVSLDDFLAKDDKYRIMNPLDFHGQPLAFGTAYKGGNIEVPVPVIPWKLMTGQPEELVVLIVMKGD